MIAPKFTPVFDKEIPQNLQIHLRQLYQTAGDHDQAIVQVNSKIGTSTSTSSTSTNTSSSTSAVTSAQATSIANTQAASVIAQTFGVVNPQSGTAYTAQSGDYAGLITFNNAAPVAAVLNSLVSPQWFTAMENLGAGTVTVTPDVGLINGLVSIPLVTGAGALIYRNPDGTNWSALTIPASGGGSGVSSLDGITGPVTLVAGSGVTITDNSPSPGDITIAATGTSGVASLQGETGAVTLTSSGATVVITTPTSSTINLESTGGGGSYLKGTVTIAFGGATTGSFSGTATIAGATVSMAAICTPGNALNIGGTTLVHQSWITATVTAANTVTVTVDIAFPNAPIGLSTITFPIVVFA